jgi:hypothetical protein
MLYAQEVSEVVEFLVKTQRQRAKQSGQLKSTDEPAFHVASRGMNTREL